MPNFVFENCSALFTYGVGNDDRFEIEFAKIYQKPVYLFDHTIFAPVPGHEEEQKQEIIRKKEYWKKNGYRVSP